MVGYRGRTRIESRRSCEVCCAGVEGAVGESRCAFARSCGCCSIVIIILCRTHQRVEIARCGSVAVAVHSTLVGTCAKHIGHIEVVILKGVGTRISITAHAASVVGALHYTCVETACNHRFVATISIVMAADTAHILISFDTSHVHTFLYFGIVAVTCVTILSHYATHIFRTGNISGVGTRDKERSVACCGVVSTTVETRNTANIVSTFYITVVMAFPYRAGIIVQLSHNTTGIVCR